MKRVAAIQSNYIPWRGYFDVIALVDEFILLDEVQFTKRDWRNRNRIKTTQGVQWLTIPVHVKGRYEQRIDEVEVSDPDWAERHWKTLQHAYAPAPFFNDLAPAVQGLYGGIGAEGRLSEINRRLLMGLADLLGISTQITSSTDYASRGTKTERLVTLCEAAGASEYVSGPAARGYLDEEAFSVRGISVSWMDYSGYPDYPQVHPPFVPDVSVVDLLFNMGPDAPRQMKHASPTPNASGVA